ncbi:hypothetical protein IG631_06258 [Alternaria alternata]|nr:hypothetical protein IG631_06258 [Alternaria alternata]
MSHKLRHSCVGSDCGSGASSEGYGSGGRDGSGGLRASQRLGHYGGDGAQVEPIWQ